MTDEKQAADAHDEAVRMATYGEPDAWVVMALVLALAGACDAIETATARHVQAAPSDADARAAIEAAWAALDDVEDVAVLRGAVVVLGNRMRALRAGAER